MGSFLIATSPTISKIFQFLSGIGNIFPPSVDCGRTLNRLCHRCWLSSLSYRCLCSLTFTFLGSTFSSHFYVFVLYLRKEDKHLPNATISFQSGYYEYIQDTVLVDGTQTSSSR